LVVNLQRFFVSLLLLLLLACAPAVLAQSQPETVALSSLWIDMGLNPQLTDWFNRNARTGDIARVDHVSLVDLLDAVTVGRKLVIFKSVADVEQLMPLIGDKFDIIGYNLEHGPSNRPDEIADPVGSVIRMRALADRYGKELALGPDREFALNNGPAMAPYVDIFVLQVQRVQTEPQTVREFVMPLVQQLRRANPQLQVSVQVRTEGDVVAITNLLSSMRADLDGISILTSPETVAVAEALGTEVRRTDVTPAPLITPTLTVVPNEPPINNQPPPAVTPDVQGPPPPWFCAGGLVMTGLLGAGILIAVLIHTLRRDRFMLGKPHG